MVKVINQAMATVFVLLFCLVLFVLFCLVCRVAGRGWAGGDKRREERRDYPPSLLLDDYHVVAFG